MRYEFASSSAEDTQAFGFELGKRLRGGDVVCLIGDLGAGKTALAQGIGRALGVQDSLSSPTFTLMHQYPVQVDGEELTLVHFDLYRLRQPEEAEIIGLAEMIQENSICLVEWPEIGEDLLPEDRLNVRIVGSGDLERNLTVEAAAGEWDERLQELLSKGW